MHQLPEKEWTREAMVEGQIDNQKLRMRKAQIS